MFVIYGKKAKLKRAWQLNHKCPHCSQENTINLGVATSYFHIFWIPFFPVGRKGFVTCTHCGYSGDVKETTMDIDNTYEAVKKEVKFPITYYSGLVLLAIFIGFVVFSIDDVEAKKNRPCRKSESRRCLYN